MWQIQYVELMACRSIFTFAVSVCKISSGFSITRSESQSRKLVCVCVCEASLHRHHYCGGVGGRRGDFMLTLHHEDLRFSLEGNKTGTWPIGAIAV